MESSATAEETLARWLAEEHALRERLQSAGVSKRDEVAPLSGMEFFEAMLEGRLPPPPIGATLDFLPMHIGPGHAVFQGAPGRAHYNPLGTVHGGWFATLLDSALACAVHSQLPAGKSYTTLELKLNIVRALTDKVRVVRAEGRVVHGGKQVATAEGRLFGPDGTLYAHASTTCLVFSPPSAARA